MKAETRANIIGAILIFLLFGIIQIFAALTWSHSDATRILLVLGGVIFIMVAAYGYAGYRKALRGR